MREKDFRMCDKSIVYFDNAATSFKPDVVLDKMNDYYQNYCSNAHRGGYDISYETDNEYEKTRDKVKEFINASKREEIVFTSGATQSLNMIVNGFFKNYLKDGDGVLLTKAEHASNILPWFNLKNIKVDYIELDNDLITLESIKNSIKDNTKVISIAHVTNVMGEIRPVKEIIEYAHKKNILVVIDAAQSAPHMKIDVQDMDADFMSFSAHKMCGPTGVGVLYGKYIYLDKLEPQNVGGGMNNDFESNVTFKYKELPYRLEAGTPNIAGIIGFGAAIDYLNTVKMSCIDSYTKNLRKYAIIKLSTNYNIDIYNKNIESTTIVFNVKGIHSEDVATYLNKKGICVRSGNHCAKMLKDDIGVTSTVRASFYFYNTREDVDKLVEALNETNILEKSLF